jgi:catechol 2,3-dioxygenase-like lactoylglutathione lyase family enzyme
MMLNEIILQTKHINELYEFYKNILQLPVHKINSENILVTAGKTSLIFESVNSTTDPLYHFAFNIPSNTIEEAFQWLKNKVEILWIEEYKNYIAEFSDWNARSVYFTDPAGNILELIERSDLHDTIAETFSSSHIRCISEIGIVYKDENFDESVNELLQKFQLQYFSKQPPMKYFRGAGDDEGMFIIVPEHRNWFPTKIASGIFPLSVKFISDKKQYVLKL